MIYLLLYINKYNYAYNFLTKINRLFEKKNKEIEDKFKKSIEG